jgi:4-amino-4-deoxy-L-arabinose transferase-like glycosyltransferase
MTQDRRSAADEAPTAAIRRRAAALVLLVALGALLNGPWLAQPPFHGEESRRALPAREMLASGDWVLPTIWGRPYLNKPPGHFWLIAGTSKLTGAIDEWSTRLPSALSTVATAVVLYLAGAALFGETAGLLAGVLFLLSLNVLGKGQVGEIEPPFALAVLGSVLLLWQGREGRLPALLGAGLCLAAALLLKGPPALLFFVAATLAIAWASSDPRFLLSARPWLALAIGIAPVLVWAALVLASPHADAALDTWWAETSRTGGRSNPRAFWTDRPRFLLGALGAYLPSVLLLAAAWGTPTGRSLRSEPRFRFLLGTVAVSFGYFLVTPGPRPRYIYPLVGLCCLAGAAVVARAFREEDTTVRQRLRWLAAAGLAAAGATALAGFAPLLRPVAGLDGVSAPGVLLLLATLAAAGLGLRNVRSHADARALALALACLALLGGFRVVELREQLQGDRSVVTQMRTLELAAPGSDPLPLRVVAMWNELIYLERPLTWLEQPEKAEPGSVLLLDAAARKRLAAIRSFEALADQRIRDRRQLTVVRVGKPLGPDSGEVPGGPTGSEPAGP